MRKQLEEILKLSVEERILMVEAIWDSIADDTINKDNISPEHLKLVEESRVEYEADPSKALTWEEAREKIIAATKK